MIVGSTLQEIATQIRNEAGQKRDFTIGTDRLRFHAATGERPRGTLSFNMGGETIEVEPTRLCLTQICDRAGIPMKYADRMVGDHASLLETNINHWLTNEPEKRMLRTLVNGQHVARAFLTQRYRPLENCDLAEIVLPHMIRAGCIVKSAKITEKRLYIQAATPGMEARIDEIRKAHGWTQGNHTFLKEPDVVQAGVVVSNSEVGCGSVAIEPMLFRLRCLNGLVVAEAMRRYHIGRSTGNGDHDAQEFYSDATRQLDDKAFWNKVNDTVSAVFQPERFKAMTENFARTGGVALASPTNAVEEVTKRFKLTVEEGKSVLDNLIEGGDNSLYGLVNAVTATSRSCEDYDRGVEFERFGGQILELPQNIWGRN